MRRLLTICPLLFSSVLWAGTCGNGYSFSEKITIDHTLVPSTQTNFPFLLCFNGACTASTTLADLKTVANGGQIQNTAANSKSVTGPADLVICDAASAGNPLKYETASYTASTGASEIYVLIASLSSSADTVIYLFYGNSGVSTTQQDLSLWSDAGYTGVYHLANGSSLNLSNSAAATTATNHSATATTGQIDGGMAVAASGPQYFDTGTTYSQSGSFSLEAWVNKPACSTQFQAIMSNNSGSAGVHFYMCNGFGDRLTLETPAGEIQTSTTVPFNTWTLVSASYNTTGSVPKLWINGTDVTGSNGGGGHTAVTATNMWIGNWPVGIGGSAFDGKIDEVRIASSARSADWFQISYTNQSSPSTTYVLSASSCSGYSYSQTLTIDHTKVAANLSNFPALYATTANYLKSTGSGGSVQNASGYDVCFAQNSDGSSPLFFQIDQWNGTTGAGYYWVSIPSLSSTVDTVLYQFVGNSGITTDPSSTWVWSLANYQAVFHLGSGSVLSGADSTRNANALVALGSPTAGTGKISGDVVTGTSNSLSNPSTSVRLPTGTSARTVSAWFNLSTGGGQVVGYGDGAQSTFGIWADGSNTVYGVGVDNSHGRMSKTWTPDSGVWHYLVGTLNGSGSAASNMALYFDGAAITPTTTTGTVGNSQSNLSIGNLPFSAGFYFGGGIDEARISSDAKSASWITTEFNNQNSPGTFFTSTATASGYVRHRVSQ
jgi:hypothetical protein